MSVPHSRLEDAKLTIKIKNNRPVELLDLTESLLSWGDEYKRFIAANPDAGAQNVRLYVKEIRAGSIVADLVALVAVGAPMALPYMGNAVTILDFAGYLRDSYEYLIGNRPDKRAELQKADYTNLSKLIEPVAKDNGSQINITATDGGNVHINFGIIYLTQLLGVHLEIVRHFRSAD